MVIHSYNFIYFLFTGRAPGVVAIRRQGQLISRRQPFYGAPPAVGKQQGDFLWAGTSQSRPTRKNSADMEMAPASRRKTPQKAWKTHLQSQGGIPPAAPTNQTPRMWCGRHAYVTLAT